jgi:hypothetical protein
MNEVDAGTLDPRLRELAQRYAITYRVFPEWAPDARGRQQRAGFDLELSGTADPESPSRQGPPVDNEVLVASHAAVREVVDWALAGGATDVCISVDPWNQTLVHEPKAGRWLVQVAAHVLHCGSVGRPVDESQQRYLSEVRHRLTSLGVREQ